MTIQPAGPVVVGVDGSASSQAAIEAAAWEARRRHLPLRLVHGVVPPAAYGPTFSAARVTGAELGEARRMLGDAVGRVTDRHPGLAVTQAVVVQGPAGLLVDESRIANLVVVGWHGRGAIPRLLTGSLTGQVAAYAHSPVLIVRDGVPVPGTGPVVVGLDGSPGAESALGFAAEEADVRGVPLIAVYAWQMPPAHNLGPVTRRHYKADDAQQEADRLLAEAVAGWSVKYPDLTVERRAIYSFNAAETLREAAQGAGLLVVGCRGHGGFAALLLGSVSHALVGHAPTTLAIVHTL